MKKKIKVVMLIVGVLVSLVSGCGQTEDETDGKLGEKNLVFGDTTFNAENGEPDIDPHHDNSGWACIRYGVGETLFRFTDNMELEPWLAKSYERVDQRTWRIILKDGVTFTSGRTMDAEAVKACLEDLIVRHKRAAGDLHIDMISAEGMVLTIRTKTPVPALINYLTDPYGCIYDVEAGVTEEGIVQGTGPYRAVSLETDTRLDLVKNENYWNGDPKLDRITVRTITDGNTLTMALQSGEIDAAYGMPYASYPLFENDDYIFTGCATSRVFFVTMNFESEVTSDPDVRKAIAMGIDKEGFVETLLGGNGYPAEGVYPSTFAFGGDVVKDEEYDPKGARKILEEAGWKDEDGDGVREKNKTPLILRLLTYPSRQELPLLAEAAQASLGEIGFQVEITDTADHNRIRTDSSAWDIYVSAMVTAPSADPEYFFNYRCLESSGNNDGHYYSEQLEKMAGEMSTTFDTDRRAQLAVKMQQLILEDHAYVFCSHLRMNMIAKANVTGLKAHPCDYYEITADLDIE